MPGAAKAPSAQPFHPPPPGAGHLGFNEPGIGRQAVGGVVHQDGDLEALDRLDHRCCASRLAEGVQARLHGRPSRHPLGPLYKRALATLPVAPAAPPMRIGTEALSAAPATLTFRRSAY